MVGNITCIFNRENNSFKAKVEVRNIKHISLNIAEEIKKILPPTLEKDLQDDEIICPVCHGLGIIKQDYNFGVKENDSEKIFKLNWYDNEYLTLCPHCYFGRLKTCKYCGKVLPKSVNRCDCKDFLEHEREKQRIKYQETIDKAKEIDLKDASYYMYDEQSEKYFFDEGEFVDYYLQEYKDGSGGCSNFNEFLNMKFQRCCGTAKKQKSQWMQIVLSTMLVKNYMKMQEIIFLMRRNCKSFLISGVQSKVVQQLIILVIENM